MLKDIKTTETQTEERDTLGGGGYIWDSGIYPVTIVLAYMDTYASGAYNFNAIFADENGKELNWKMCVTNRKGEDFYKDKKTDEKRTLPGMQLVNSLTDIVTGKPLLELVETLAVVEIYDFDLGKKMPKEKTVFKELHGKRVVIGVHREINDKKVKNSKDVWVATGETRENNTIDKFFFADGSTRPEKAAGDPPKFMDEWKEKYEGLIQDKSTGASPAAIEKDPVKRDSLFPDK